MSARGRISVSGPALDESAVRQLAALDQVVEQVDVETEGWSALDGCWAHILGGTEKLDAAAANALPDSIELVCFLGTGYQAQLDVEALAARDVTACYTPYAHARSTAEFALGLLIAGLREIVAGMDQVARGEWSPPRGRSLRDCTVGIVGYGHVGRELLAMLSRGFGITPLVWNRTPHADAIRRDGGQPVDIDSIFTRCDAITLHADQAPGDPPLIDARLLGLARSGLVLVNTARGGLIDPSALLQALERDRTMRVLADVYPQEPVRRENDPHGLLSLEADRFLLTPHMAYSTRDSARSAGAMVFANLDAYLNGRAVPYIVHAP